MLSPPAHLGLNSGALQLLAQTLNDLINIALTITTAFIQGFGQRFVNTWIKHPQGTVFQFPFKLTDA